MSESVMHVTSDDATVEGEAAPIATTSASPRPRTRTCVGCGARVEVLGPGGADLVRLILGPGGAIAVDAASRRGSGFGRGAHLHARRACLERAARSGLQRAAKGVVHWVDDGADRDERKGDSVSTDSLARAIQTAMDRRIEGLLAAAVRSRQVARGADAVTGAYRRGEAELVLVACDAAAAADLTEVRRAVRDGRAVAWGNEVRLGAIVAPFAVRGKLRLSQGAVPGRYEDAPPLHPEGVGVIAIASATIAEAVRQAVQAANAVTPSAATSDGTVAGRGRRQQPAPRPTMGQAPPPPAQPVTMGETSLPPARPVTMQEGPSARPGQATASPSAPTPDGNRQGRSRDPAGPRRARHARDRRREG